jgi:hypothetical protein
MDGRTRHKLLKAGYRIFRTRDCHVMVTAPASEPYEIRETSLEREWFVHSRYATKAARARAWNTLMEDPLCLADGGEARDGGDK